MSLSITVYVLIPIISKIVELYVVVKEMASMTQTSFAISDASGSWMPWEILMAFVIIAAKMLFGLDDKERSGM
jgi:hypothetical protein